MPSGKLRLGNGTVRSHPLENSMLGSFTPKFLQWFLARIPVHLSGLQVTQGSFSGRQWRTRPAQRLTPGFSGPSLRRRSTRAGPPDTAGTANGPHVPNGVPYLWAKIGEEGKGDSRPWLLQGGCSGVLFGNEDLSMMVTQVVGPLICPVAQP